MSTCNSTPRGSSPAFPFHAAILLRTSIASRPRPLTARYRGLSGMKAMTPRNRAVRWYTTSKQSGGAEKGTSGQANGERCGECVQVHSYTMMRQSG